MQALADLLRFALEREVLHSRDLWTTEPQVLAKLKADPGCKEQWHRFCAYSRILRRREPPASGYWVSVDAKKRWIDPLHIKLGRVSKWNAALADDMEEFQKLDLSHWLSGE